MADNDPLPPDWKEETDDSTGRIYYANYATNEVQWERPKGAPAKPRVALAAYTPAAPLNVNAGSESVFQELARLREEVEKLRSRTDTYERYAAQKNLSSKYESPDPSRAAGLGASGGVDLRASMAVGLAHPPPPPPGEESKDGPAAPPKSMSAGNPKMDATLSSLVSKEKSYFSGWCEKEGGSIKNWKKRFFVLYKNRLDYFDKNSLKGTIELANCEISAKSKREGIVKPCLALKHGKRKYYFVSFGPLEENDNKAWFSILHNHVIAATYIAKCEQSGAQPDDRIVNFLIEAHSRRVSLDVILEPTPLALNNRPLSAETLAVVATVLADPECVPITALDCINAGLTATDAEKLVRALVANPKGATQRFNFSGNKVGIAWALPLLQSPTTIKDLIIEDCKIVDADLEYLAKAISDQGIQSQTTLAHLECANNSIGDNGIAALSSILGSSAYSLVYLGLNSNLIGDNGCVVVAQMLAQFRTLLFLMLRDNHVADPGATAIAKSLDYNKHLLVLDLAVNDRIGTPGATALSHMVQSNDSLERLSFCGHELQKQGLTVLRLIGRYGVAPREDAK